MAFFHALVSTFVGACRRASSVEVCAASTCAALALAAAALTGCGHMAGFSQPAPISVSLAEMTVSLSQNGTPVTVSISITSTSETASVSVTSLPAGVQEVYASSDTNPSGTLRFTADNATPVGTYTPLVTAVSAGQTATTTFVLVVTAR